jgi:hypothetical protein
MIEIKPLPSLPVTQLDPAPKPTPRADPADVATEKVHQSSPGGVERRNNPDRRRRNVAVAFERRLGGGRRRRTVDIQV